MSFPSGCALDRCLEAPAARTAADGVRMTRCVRLISRPAHTLLMINTEDTVKHKKDNICTLP